MDDLFGKNQDEKTEYVSEDGSPCSHDIDSNGIEPMSRSECLSMFKLIYESKDGGLCLFERKDGHTVVIRGSRLV